MTVVVLSLAALGLVALIAAVASRWDKGQPEEEPDLKPDEKKSSVATVSALAGIGRRKRR